LIHESERKNSRKNDGPFDGIYYIMYHIVKCVKASLKNLGACMISNFLHTYWWSRPALFSQSRGYRRDNPTYSLYSWKTHQSRKAQLLTSTVSRSLTGVRVESVRAESLDASSDVLPNSCEPCRYWDISLAWRWFIDSLEVERAPAAAFCHFKYNMYRCLNHILVPATKNCSDWKWVSKKSLLPHPTSSIIILEQFWQPINWLILTKL